MTRLMDPLDGDHPNEECGVFGVVAPDRDVARVCFFGLHALQHRGQESAGIAVSDGTHIIGGNRDTVFVTEQILEQHAGAVW